MHFCSNHVFFFFSGYGCFHLLVQEQFLYLTNRSLMFLNSSYISSYVSFLFLIVLHVGFINFSFSLSIYIFTLKVYIILIMWNFCLLQSKISWWKKITERKCTRNIKISLKKTRVCRHLCNWNRKNWTLALSFVFKSDKITHRIQSYVVTCPLEKN